MSYLRTRTRELSPEYDTLYSRPLVRRDSKRQRIIALSDDEDDCYDDYPYSPKHKPVKVSRALTIRNQPSQLERYNIWSDGREKHSSSNGDEEKAFERRRTHKPTPHRYNHSDDDDKTDDEEREFRLKVQAAFSKPNALSPSRHYDLPCIWPTSLFRSSKEKWLDEDWETRERSSSHKQRFTDTFWDDEEEKDEEKESWSRYRRIKRTKTEEYRPLSRWRTERIIYGC